MQKASLSRPSYSWWKDIALITLIIGGLFFILLGVRPLFVPDEGRYAEIAREMVASGNYVTPYLNGIKYFEKPALFYWLESIAIHWGGLNLWSLRSINALLGLFGCIITYCTGRQLYDRSTGLLAALILGTSALYFVMAHMISLDLPVTFFLMATLYAFILGIQHINSPSRRYYFWTSSIAAACAVLTKGLIGLVFPLMIITTWIALLGEWRLLKRVCLPSCLFIFFLITTPWHLLVGSYNPEFFYFYFIKQHFLRYTTLKIGHYQPVWFFIPTLMLGFFPWIVFLPQTIKQALPSSWQTRHQQKNALFFLLWAVLIFIFFSFSKSKLIPYILPVFPPLAILTAHYLQQAIACKNTIGLKLSYAALLIFSSLIMVVFFIFPHYVHVPDPITATRYLYLAGTVLFIGILTANLFVYRHPHRATTITFSTCALFLLLFYAAIPAIDARTIKPLSNRLKPILRPNDEVITYNQYYQDLPFYLERRVTILNWKNELTFGSQHQNKPDWMINDPIFWQHWHSQRRIFVIMGAKEYHQFRLRHAKETDYLIAQTINNVLISNKELPD